MRLHEFIKDADDQEVTELIGAVARGIGGAAKLGAKAVRGATGAIGSMACAMGEPGVAAAMKTPAPNNTGAVQKALAKTEPDPAQQAAERKELADKIQELEAQVRELRKAQSEV